MRVIGVDPGSRVVGFGVIDVEGSRLSLVEAGVIRADANAPLEERLAAVAAGLQEALGRCKPDCAAVEDVFVKVNPRAALSIGHARGALLAVLGEKKIPVGSHAPAAVKRSIAGNGKAAKPQVARMVGAILGTGREFPLDATDALAVAIAHALGRQAQLLAEKKLT